MSPETLNRYRIDYEFDEDSEYLLIKRWVPEEEKDLLWEHTREIREMRKHVLLAIEGKEGGRDVEFEFVRKKPYRGRTGKEKKDARTKSCIREMERKSSITSRTSTMRIIFGRGYLRKSFRRQLRSEAKEKVRAVAKFLGGGGASESSGSESDSNLDSGSSYASDEGSLPDEDTTRMKRSRNSSLVPSD